jgi:hypothetical protein
MGLIYNFDESTENCAGSFYKRKTISKNYYCITPLIHFQNAKNLEIRNIEWFPGVRYKGRGVLEWKGGKYVYIRAI